MHQYNCNDQSVQKKILNTVQDSFIYEHIIISSKQIYFGRIHLFGRSGKNVTSEGKRQDIKLLLLINNIFVYF